MGLGPATIDENQNQNQNEKEREKQKDGIPEDFFPGGFKYTEMECTGANARSTGTHDCRWGGALRLHSRPDVAQSLCRSRIRGKHHGITNETCIYR